MGLSCAEFAERCELPLELVRGIIDGEAPIELATADRFQSVLGVDAKLWMSLENDYRRRSRSPWFSTWYPCSISWAQREEIPMLIKPSQTTDEDLPEGRMLTEDESREMKENLAREYFDMSLVEFTQAWKAGKFDDDKERHGDVIFLATMLPEAWAD